MHKAEVKAVIMEVSSHALEMGRLGGLKFDLAVFTNLSRDHLDYHGSMEEYFEAKKKLFANHLRFRRGSQKKYIVASAEDEYGRRILEEYPDISLSFAIRKPAAIKGTELRIMRDGFTLFLHTPKIKLDVNSPLLGEFNALNVIGALACAYALDLEFEQAVKTVATCQGAPGRLEKVGRNPYFLVLVDYAHTPDALRSVLQTIRTLDPKKLICIFGCGGDRDKGKRSIMGQQAGLLADVAILTSDNPRTENPLRIIEETAVGLDKLGLHAERWKEKETLIGKSMGSYLIEPDRAEAIKIACHIMNSGDIIVIAGKGHEDYQIIGTQKIHFDDREHALSILTEMGRG
jgi:UDP-N-acetylmuramoyl-L-alanyl-D-glutamate--2,6-diaminopimelate ligase